MGLVTYINNWLFSRADLQGEARLHSAGRCPKDPLKCYPCYEAEMERTSGAMCKCPAPGAGKEYRCDDEQGIPFPSHCHCSCHKPDKPECFSINNRRNDGQLKL